MRGLVACVVGALLLTVGSVGLVAPGASPGTGSPHAMLAAVGVDLDGLLGSATWSGRFEALTGVPPVPFREEREVPELVASLYARLGLPVEEEAFRVMAARAERLDGRVAEALQQLLGAIDLGILDWAAATAAWTEEDRRFLASLDVASVEVPPEARRIAAKADVALLRASAQRILGVIDALPSLAGVAHGEPEVFAGPNQGLLFNDPYNIILVGGPGESVYVGNTGPALMAPLEHLLILDVGGNDRYLSHAASAHPFPNVVCGFNICNGGFPVSLAVDVTGNDVYAPNDLTGSTLAFGDQGGIGMLVDLAGNDAYLARLSAGIGLGAFAGVGAILEADGSDVYTSLRSSSQGMGLSDGGLGLLMDLKGDDHYVGSISSLGASGAGGNGLHVDLGGRDHVASSSRTQGSSLEGVAIFLHLGGQDQYSSATLSRGWAGSCFPDVAFACVVPGFAALFMDLCGQDAYHAGAGSDGAAWQQGAVGVGLDQNAPALDCAMYE